MRTYAYKGERIVPHPLGTGFWVPNLTNAEDAPVSLQTARAIIDRSLEPGREPSESATWEARIRNGPNGGLVVSCGRAASRIGAGPGDVVRITMTKTEGDRGVQ